MAVLAEKLGGRPEKSGLQVPLPTLTELSLFDSELSDSVGDSGGGFCSSSCGDCLDSSPPLPPEPPSSFTSRAAGAEVGEEEPRRCSLAEDCKLSD